MSVVLRTDVEPSEPVVLLRSQNVDVTLRLAGIVHARADITGRDGDIVDEITARELPLHGPWPVEARHLLQHHNNRSVLQWLTITGPSKVEIAAVALTIDERPPSDGLRSDPLGHRLDGVTRAPDDRQRQQTEKEH
ncbi:hypothetical protein AB0I28_19660 [Phytomonospora sp. NPDC050363]|uniref:hypothetical protein n=1 Tax=Phytomonospora sp. NPDC050363 TaxID=3155642 RepID=UPI0033F2C15E